MNEGIGSSTILVIIVVFIAFVSAYMAFNVNYTKAFRMKNKIVNLYEEYNGVCTNTIGDGGLQSCESKIQSYKSEIAYSGGNIDCENNFYRPSNSTIDNNYRVDGFCIYKVKADTSVGEAIAVDPNKDGYYYRVVTRIDIRIPIVQNALNLRILNVTGDTSVFEVK